MSLVGKKFPNITVDAISHKGENLRINVLEEAIKNNKKVLLFWYPKDFTFVCPTELHAFQTSLGEFENRNTIVVGASCNTNEVHFAWLNTPKNNGGIEGVTYPLLADTTRNLSAALEILDAEWVYDAELNDEILEGSNVTFRATYLIDETGKIFHESVNDMPLGRNVNEYLRLIDAYAMQVQTVGEVCPANWNKGQEAMTADRLSTAAYLSQN